MMQSAIGNCGWVPLGPSHVPWSAMGGSMRRCGSTHESLAFPAIAAPSTLLDSRPASRWLPIPGQ